MTPQFQTNVPDALNKARGLPKTGETVPKNGVSEMRHAVGVEMSNRSTFTANVSGLYAVDFVVLFRLICYHVMASPLTSADFCFWRFSEACGVF